MTLAGSSPCRRARRSAKPACDDFRCSLDGDLARFVSWSSIRPKTTPSAGLEDEALADDEVDGDRARSFPAARQRQLASILYKERKDGLSRLLITGANSPASLCQVTIDAQVQDDVAKYEVNAMGDPELMADSRSRAIADAKIFKISTPLVAPGCRVTRNFLDGSQEHPYCACPHCGVPQILEWENFLANLDPAKPDEAHFTCVACGLRHRRERSAANCSPPFSGARITLQLPKSIARFGFGAHTATSRLGRRSRVNGFSHGRPRQ